MSSNDFFFFDMSAMERIELFDGMIFGRDETCDVVVDDEMVSGSHFKIQIIDYELYIIDLESSNKTIVNDVEILPNKKVKLNPKDVIIIGSQEYAYSSGAIRKLNLPELSNTLKVAKFGLQSDPSLDIDRIQNDQVYEENDHISLKLKVEVKDKPETGLKALRQAKKYLDELNQVEKEILEKIDNLKKMRRRKIEVGAKMDQMKKVLANSEFKTDKDFEKELRIHRGTIEGFKLKIQKEEKTIEACQKIIDAENEKIAQAKFNISSLEGQSMKSKDNLDAVNDEYDIYKNKGAFENEFESLKDSIKTYESLDLDKKKEEVKKEIKLKTKQYKEMQNHYGAKLNSEIKKKAASE